MEQAKALESLLYEMMMLGSAVLVRDTRYFFKKYESLQWGPAQIAHDVIRLKCRLLLDFFQPQALHPNDIIVEDFSNCVTFTIDRNALEALPAFRKKVNKWTVHLSWVRAEEPEYSKRDRQLMEEYALLLLRLGADFVDQCVTAGLVLEGWGARYHESFKRLHAHLLRTRRAEEGRVPMIQPHQIISLEELALRFATA